MNLDIKLYEGDIFSQILRHLFASPLGIFWLKNVTFIEINLFKIK